MCTLIEHLVSSLMHQYHAVKFSNSDMNSIKFRMKLQQTSIAPSKWTSKASCLANEPVIEHLHRRNPPKLRKNSSKHTDTSFNEININSWGRHTTYNFYFSKLWTLPTHTGARGCPHLDSFSQIICYSWQKLRKKELGHIYNVGFLLEQITVSAVVLSCLCELSSFSQTITQTSIASSISSKCMKAKPRDLLVYLSTTSWQCFTLPYLLKKSYNKNNCIT